MLQIGNGLPMHAWTYPFGVTDFKARERDAVFERRIKNVVLMFCAADILCLKGEAMIYM